MLPTDLLFQLISRKIWFKVNEMQLTWGRRLEGGVSRFPQSVGGTLVHPLYTRYASVRVKTRMAQSKGCSQDIQHVRTLINDACSMARFSIGLTAAQYDTLDPDVMSTHVHTCPHILAYWMYHPLLPNRKAAGILTQNSA